MRELGWRIPAQASGKQINGVSTVGRVHTSPSPTVLLRVVSILGSNNFAEVFEIRVGLFFYELSGKHMTPGFTSIRTPDYNRILPHALYVLKVLLSALVIVAIAEIAKRSTGFAALVASLPLTSLLAFVWLYLEASPLERIAELSSQIFWLVLPSLVLVLPLLLKHGFGFWSSLGVSVSATAGCYLALVPLLRRIGVIL